MIIEESPDLASPGEQPAPPRPLTPAETLARALGTAPPSAPPPPPADSVDALTDNTD